MTPSPGVAGPGAAGLEALGVEVAGVYAVPLRRRFRGITVREGVLLRGPAGWGDFCPFPEYEDAEAAPWLAAAVESAALGWPAPGCARVPVNVTVPAVDPATAHRIVAGSGCATAKVKVAEPGQGLPGDVARVEAVRDALGPGGAVRVDANGAWDVASAVQAVRALDRAAGGLEYVEQPCRTLEELAELRRRVDVPVAADESIRRAEDPLRVALAGAADVAVVKCAPLGGVRRALRVVERAGLPCVVSSALETSVGLAAGLALAAALPGPVRAAGLGTRALLDGDVVAGPDELVPVDGAVRVPEVPPAPSASALDRFAMPDAARRRWWWQRLVRVAGFPGALPTDLAG